MMGNGAALELQPLPQPAARCGIDSQGNLREDGDAVAAPLSSLPKPFPLLYVLSVDMATSSTMGGPNDVWRRVFLTCKSKGAGSEALISRVHVDTIQEVLHAAFRCISGACS